MDTSVLGVLKNLINIHKLLKMPRKRHKRNWERVAVVHWLFYSVVAPKGVFECLSVNLALQKFLQVINFHFTWTTKCLQPVIATRIFPPRARKYHKICECSQGRWPTVLLFFLISSWQIRRLSYQAPVLKFLAYCRFPDIFIQVVSPEGFLFMSTRLTGQAQAQTLPNN